MRTRSIDNVFLSLMLTLSKFNKTMFIVSVNLMSERMREKKDVKNLSKYYEKCLKVKFRMEIIFVPFHTNAP